MTLFFSDQADLIKINWSAVDSNDFTDPKVKEGKQAEFLMYESFPFSLVERIGVLDVDRQEQVLRVLNETSANKSLVTVKRDWYFKITPL